MAEQSAEAIARLLLGCFATAFPALGARHGATEATAVMRAFCRPASRTQDYRPGQSASVSPMTEELQSLDTIWRPAYSLLPPMPWHWATSRLIGTTAPPSARRVVVAPNRKRAGAAPDCSNPENFNREGTRTCRMTWNWPNCGSVCEPGGSRSARELEAVYDIPVTVSAVLGKTTMQVNQLLKLGRGAVVELDRKLGEAIDIYVNNRLVARGEVVMVDDTRLGVTMTEIVKGDRSPS